MPPTPQEVFYQLPLPVVVLEPNGGIKYRNPSAEKFLKNKIADFKSESWTHRLDQCLSNDLVQFPYEEWSSLCCLKKIPPTETHGTAILAIFMDATDSNNQIMRTVESNRLKELSEMAASIAHEVNNPLTVIYSRAQILIQTLQKNGAIDSKTLDEGLRKILLQAERVNKIIRSIRSFSRDTAQDPFVSTSLTVVLQETLNLVSATLRDLGVTVKTKGLEQECMIQGRASDLMQVFLNLINNAIDAIKNLPFPEISIVVIVDNSIHIRISDSGAGVDSDLEKKIFLPFYTTKPVGSGTGIGLSVASRIALNHGGRIFLNREYGKSCFEVELPKEIQEERK